MANNIVLNPQRGDQIALTGVVSSYNQPSAFQPIGVTVYSTASISANANNALVGRGLAISGFLNANNNGNFVVLASTATTITVNNPYGVVVTAAGTASSFPQGFPSHYASVIENNWSNQNGDSVVVNANAADCLVAIAIGMKSYQPFDLLHGSSQAPGFLPGLNDFNANPTVYDSSSGATPATVTAVGIAKNNFVLSGVNTAGAITATSAVSTPYALSSAANASSGTTVYGAGSVFGGTNNLVGYTFVVAGFVTNPLNNGTFTCTANTPTSITLNNANGVAESHAATATDNVLTVTTGLTPGVGATVLIQGSEESSLNGQQFVTVTSSGTQFTANYTGTAFSISSEAATAYAATVSTSGSTTYTGTITGGASNALAGYYFTVSGFSHSANNGTFLCSASSATALTLSNANGIGEVTAASAYDLVLTLTATNTFSVGNRLALSGFVNAPFLNGNVVTLVTASSSSVTANYPQFVEPYTGTESAASAVAQGSNVWTLTLHQNIIGADYTPTQTPPAAPNPYPSSKWNLDQYYPSIYVWTAPNVAAGSYKVTLNSMYQPGIDAPTDYSQGALPIFNGGVKFLVYCLSGVATSSPVEASSISTTDTIANPATAPATLTVANTDGDAILSIGLCKNSNAFTTGTVNVTSGAASGAALQLIGNGKLPGSEAHYLIEYGLVTTGTYNPNFSNPLGYPTLVASLAIKST